MSQYEGWNNIETFMVASLIDNDRAFLKYVMEAVEQYMVNGMEDQIPDKLARMVTKVLVIPLENIEREVNEPFFLSLRFKATIEVTVLQAFYEEVVWDELAEHYKAKYVENLINDKELFPDSPKSNS